MKASFFLPSSPCACRCVSRITSAESRVTHAGTRDRRVLHRPLDLSQDLSAIDCIMDVLQQTGGDSP